MAVRKIGINSRSITGRHGRSGQQFESALERDFLDLMAFDLNVEGYETQPIKLRYEGSDGDSHPYTPDVLVRYRRDVLPARDMPHLLAEVKYRDEYRENFHDLKQRFRVAQRYAKEQGWRFRVFTEREIRTPYLKNARFLTPFRSHLADPVREALVLVYLATHPETTPKEVVDALGKDQMDRARFLPMLWKLVANFQIAADLSSPLGMRCRITRREQP